MHADIKQADNQEQSETDGVGESSWSADQTALKDHLTGDEKRR